MSESNNPSENGQAKQPEQENFLIIGLGASAGGIEALKEFFEQVPADSGMVYVVILHLSPDHDSRLAEVIQGVAQIPVTQVTEKVSVVPNHVYVVPPNRHLMMQDGTITVTPNLLVEERRAPVDIFFRTLAESHGPQAVCVVLSGTGANGSMGLKRIKERGGAAFVQNPREAAFNEMPRNAIATDLVDDVLPVAEIPAKIIKYKESLGRVAIPAEPAARLENQEHALREIFTQLRVRTGHDFSNYKRPTLLRRIERRINIRHLPDLPSYAALLRENPDETQALLKDLLISVTNFFRDHKSFDVIERDILPQLFQGKTSEEQVRIWVVGCATGEEAYSLAMLCAERLLGAVDAPKVQIFATDIDEAAIATAREGLYTINDAADVSPDRLRRFFAREGDEYRIRREIREMILFAHHNVLKDPPFSHLNLVSCRNLLIYLNNTAQERVMETFHFALNPGGHLFLGNSESTDGAGDLFAAVSKEHNIFQTRQTGARPFPVPEFTPQFRFDPPPVVQTVQEQGKRALERITYGDLHQQLLEQYAPPSVVINEEYDIMHLSERAGRYLQITGGNPSMNLLKVAREELRLELRSALYQAVQRQTNVEARNLKIQIEGRLETINLYVRPVLRHDDPARGFLLVLFEPSDEKAAEVEAVYTSPDPLARQLEEELTRAKSRLRTSIEQYEIQAEELKASNEELQAMNEELRSSTEELETSKEELQSINEELRTVNQELKIKIEETSITSNNLQNIINSTDIGTIFLDRSLRVNLFTPGAREIFNLIPNDIGRPLSDITHRLEYKELLDDAEVVLEKLKTVEREVRTVEGRKLLMRVLPYRTSDDRIQGVVATFLDITERKLAEEAITADLKATQLLHRLGTRLVSEENSQVIYDEIMVAAIALTNADAGTVQIFDESTQELVLLATRGIEQKMAEHFYRVDASSNTSCGVALATSERTFIDFDVPEADDPDGSLRMHVEAGYLSGQSTPLITRSGKAIGMVSTHWRKHYRPTERELRFLDLLARQAADLIELRLSEKAVQEVQEELRQSESRFRAFISASYDAVYNMSADWTEMRSLVGKNFIPNTDSPSTTWLEKYIIPEDQPQVLKVINEAIRTKSLFELEHRVVRVDGSLGWAHSRAIPLLDEAGEITGWFGTVRNITERKHSEEALRRSEERLRLMMDSVTDYAIFFMDTDGRIERWNVGAEKLFGWTAEEAVGQRCDIIFTPEDQAAGAPEQERQQAREQGRAADERWHVRKDGMRFYVSGVMSMLRDGELTGYVKIARDLTERMKTEEELRRSREELEQAVQVRTRELSTAYNSLVREVGERRAAEERVKELLRQVIDAQEKERRSISRELHDSLGQQLTALRMGLESLQKLNQPEISGRVADLQQMLKRLDSEVDFLAWELRPASLDEFGLVPALSTFVEEWSKQFEVVANFHTNASAKERLFYEIETSLYRIAQEALNNVAKHAQAKEVSVLLERRNEHIALIIEDNGIGFDPQQLAALPVTDKGLGLLGMRERAMLVGGSLEIESSPQSGTTIFVRVPLSSQKSE